MAQSQAERYGRLCALRVKQVDSDYSAALYLLSCDQELHEAVCEFVSRDGIDFAGIKRSTCDFDEKTKLIVDIAHNLFSYNSPCKATPYEISRLGYPLVEQVCNAFRIAADEILVEIQRDKDKKDTLTFDATPYQRKKQVYSWLEHLQESVTEEEPQDTVDEDASEKNSPYSAEPTHRQIAGYGVQPQPQTYSVGYDR